MSRAAPDPIRQSVLASGVDDWVDLVEVVSFVREHDPGSTERDALPQAVAVVRSLLRDGLVRLGDVTEAGFVPWPGDTAEVEQRLDRAVRTVTLPLRFGDGCWLENTHRGNEYGTGNGPSEFRFAAAPPAPGAGPAAAPPAPGAGPATPAPTVDGGRRERLLGYLRGGAPLPGGYRTDGEWIWPERVCRELEDRGVAPEPELVARIEQLGYYCPPVTSETVDAASTALARHRAGEPDVGSVP